MKNFHKVEDQFVWIDPEGAHFVRACREALAVERRAYALASARANRAEAKLLRIKEVIDGRGAKANEK